MTKTETTALNTYDSASYYQIPADVRWTHIRDGLARSLELSQFTLRAGAASRGSHFITRGEARDLDAGHWALCGRP